MRKVHKQDYLRKIQSELKDIVSRLSNLALQVEALIEKLSDTENGSDSDHKDRASILSIETTDCSDSQETISSHKPSQKLRVADHQVTNSNQSFHKENFTNFSPFEIGDFVKITNNYKRSKGTVGRVLSCSRTYTSIEDLFGEVHKREHHNFTNNLTVTDEQLVTTWLKGNKT